MKSKKKKKKKGFLDGYKTYDPNTEGYGDSEHWASAFKARMGIDEAKDILGDEDPMKILDINSTATWDEIKRAYRKLIIKFHPDKNHGKEAWATTMTKKINAAFTLIKDRRGK